MNLSYRTAASSLAMRVVAALLLTILVPGVIVPTSPSKAAGSTLNCDLASMGAQGDGTSEATAWQISNPDQLWEITDCTGGFFELVQDIDASTATVPTTSPIGTDAQGLKDALVGTLDGKGFAISFSMSLSGSVGLFNQLDGATVKNLTLRGSLLSRPSTAVHSGALAVNTVGRNTISNVVVESSISARARVGGFFGQIEDGSAVSFQNAEFNGFLEAVGGMSGGSGWVGGFVGRSIGPLVIRESSSTGDISASSVVTHLGGFIGIHEIDPIELRQLTRSGSISGGGNYRGGIFGVISATTFATASHLVNTGDVVAPGTYVGGIGGLFSGKLWMESALNQGEVLAGSETGGLLGRVNASTNVSLSRVVNSGGVSGSSYVGGLVGYSKGNLEIDNSENSGAISGSASVGGFVGSIDNAGSHFLLRDSENFGSVHVGASVAGGAVGNVSQVLASGILQRFTNSGVISSGNHNIGGLLGYVASPFEIYDSANTATISATGSSAGGAIGQLRPTTGNTHTVSNFVNRGLVSGGAYVAGVIGEVLTIGSNAKVALSRTANLADIITTANTNDAASGGLVGWLRVSSGDVILEIKESVNLGDATGNNRSNVGGLVGRADSATSVFIERSYSEGTMDGAGGIGGLVGAAANNLTISNSYSVATLSGTSTVGGLIGTRPSSFVIGNSYFGGFISGAVGPDGLAAGNQSGTVTFSYAITNSAFVSVSSELELRTQSTYQTWNFADVWSFGACEINNQLPVLQWAEQAFFDLSCLQVQVPTQSSQAAVVSQPTIPAASYVGPVIDGPRESAPAGSSLQLTGEKLDSVTSVEIGGVLVDVIARDATSITLDLPASLEPGTYDLVIISGFGKLTVLGAVVISAAVSKASELGELLGFSWTGAFTGNSRSLNQSQVMTIESALEKQPTATTVICWGYTTASSPNAWAIAHATQRAQAACNLVTELNPEIKTVVRIRYGEKKSYAMRASLQFWELKPAP